MNETRKTYFKLKQNRFSRHIFKATVIKYLNTALNEIQSLHDEIINKERIKQEENNKQTEKIHNLEKEIEQQNKLLEKLALHYIKTTMKD